jgi:hypothetical protein
MFGTSFGWGQSGYRDQSMGRFGQSDNNFVRFFSQ